jgi:hypothetical protein
VPEEYLHQPHCTVEPRIFESKDQRLIFLISIDKAFCPIMGQNAFLFCKSTGD